MHFDKKVKKYLQPIVESQLVDEDFSGFMKNLGHNISGKVVDLGVQVAWQPIIHKAKKNGYTVELTPARTNNQRTGYTIVKVYKNNNQIYKAGFNPNDSREENDVLSKIEEVIQGLQSAQFEEPTNEISELKYLAGVSGKQASEVNEGRMSEKLRIARKWDSTPKDVREGWAEEISSPPQNAGLKWRELSPSIKAKFTGFFKENDTDLTNDHDDIDWEASEEYPVRESKSFKTYFHEAEHRSKKK